MDVQYRNLKEGEAADQNEFHEIFERLLQKAKELVASDPSVQQVIAMLASNGQIFSCMNHDIIAGNNTEETDFVNMLAENDATEIRYCVCMWNDFTLDIPSQHLRELLVELSPFNRMTQFLLRSGEKFVVRMLDEMQGV